MHPSGSILKVIMTCFHVWGSYTILSATKSRTLSLSVSSCLPHQRLRWTRECLRYHDSRCNVMLGAVQTCDKGAVENTSENPDSSCITVAPRACTRGPSYSSNPGIVNSDLGNHGQVHTCIYTGVNIRILYIYGGIGISVCQYIYTTLLAHICAHGYMIIGMKISAQYQ